jgi:hypothetical protein
VTTHKKEAREPNAEEYRIAREWLEANFNLPLHGLIYTRLADLLASRAAPALTAEQVEKAVKDSAEESDSTGAVFYHWQKVADALNKERAAESPAGEQPAWAVIAVGEGAIAKTSSDSQLRKAIHDLMCVCGVEFWYHCRTEGIREAIETLDDDNNWITDEDGKKFSIEVCQHETGRITVYRLARSPEAKEPGK